MTMSFEVHNGYSARSEELHRHILRSHLAYLNQEETPTKLQHRHSLESLISEFLSTVSHGSKFTFFEIAKILNDSVQNNDNFSAYKAASAFEALEKYATNLISHPWRKEYKTVKLYSGFYKHSVESQLLGGDAVFQVLGYKFSDKGILYLDEPIDPDKVARVALDCLVAYVECQIMLQICERVKTFKCSWFEINQIRLDYVCNIDEAVRILHQLKRNAVEQEKQNKWLREQENGSRDDLIFKPDPVPYYQKTGILVDVSSTWPSNGSYPSYNNSNGVILQPVITAASNTIKADRGTHLVHSKLPSWSEGVSSHQHQIGNGYHHNLTMKPNEIDGHTSRSLDDHHYNSLSKKLHNPDDRYANTDLTPESWKDSWDLLQPYSEGLELPYSTNNYRKDFLSAVPNVKETFPSQFGHTYVSNPLMPLGLPTYPLPHNTTVHPRHCECKTCWEHQLSTLPQKYTFPKEGSFEASSVRRSVKPELNHVDETDYGSSFKINLGASSGASSKPRHFPVGSAFSTYQASPASDVTLRHNAGSKSQQNRSSFYDNVPDGQTTNTTMSLVGQSLTTKCDLRTNDSVPSSLPAKSKNHKVTDSGTLSAKQPVKKSYSNSSTSSVTEQLSTTLATSSLDSKNSKSQKDSKSVKKWSCSSCTFYNAPEKSICDMCGRSKNPGPEIAPLVSGGRECPQCTLVNKKDCEDCTACGSSLKDSPTYI